MSAEGRGFEAWSARAGDVEPALDAAELGVDGLQACKEAVQIVDMPGEGTERRPGLEAEAFADAVMQLVGFVLGQKPGPGASG